MGQLADLEFGLFITKGNSEMSDGKLPYSSAQSEDYIANSPHEENCRFPGQKAQKADQGKYKPVEKGELNPDVKTFFRHACTLDF